jgi:hypothetical protein
MNYMLSYISTKRYGAYYKAMKSQYAVVVAIPLSDTTGYVDTERYD